MTRHQLQPETATLDVDQFVSAVRDCGLVSADKLEQVRNRIVSEGGPCTRDTLIGELIRRGELTRFQVSLIDQGRSSDLVLGNYVVLCQLGSGGMGRVYKAEHRRMERIVALKVLPEGALASESAVQRFRQEIKAAARLEHPNIMAAYDADEARGIHFLVMQYVEGCDLGTLVRASGALAVPDAISLVMQSAQGLEYAHRAGVVHRDIKPGNLLLDRHGNLKVLDMGLARLESAVDGDVRPIIGSDGDSPVMGTVEYMAPEQSVNMEHADERSDIYSLGCSLHFLLTAETPYSGEDQTEKLLAHHQQPVPSLRAKRPEISEELDCIFQRMLAKRPTERFRTMGDVLSALQSCRLVEAHHIVRLPENLPERSADGLTLGNLQDGATLMLEKSVQLPAGLPLPQTAQIAPFRSPAPVNDIVGVVMEAMNHANVDLNAVRLEDVKRMLVDALRRAR